MNNRTPIVVSGAIVAAMLAASLWTWLHVAPGARVPIHWNADGEPNRFAPAVYGVFMAPAMTALVALLFVAIPWLEPRRFHLEQSAKFYHATWIALMLLLAAMHGAALYAAFHPAMRMGNTVLAVASLLILVVGNYLGKTRSMFLGGVRTPWTPSSEYSWQRTHSLAGKLFIAAGAVGFAAALGLPQHQAGRLFLYSMAFAAIVSVVASYVFWRRDPDRAHAGDPT